MRYSSSVSTVPDTGKWYVSYTYDMSQASEIDKIGHAGEAVVHITLGSTHPPFKRYPATASEPIFMCILLKRSLEGRSLQLKPELEIRLPKRSLNPTFPQLTLN